MYVFLMEQIALHWMDFPENSYEYFFRKSVQEIQFSLDSVKKNRYFT